MITALTVFLAAASPAPSAALAIEDAIPSSARSALFVQKFAQELEPAVDAMERILDPSEADAFIDTAPLPAMALESLQSDDDFGLDRHGGIALYRPELFEVAVGVAPITDRAKALSSLEETMKGHGISAPEKLDLGMFRYRMHGGVDVIAFVKRGFLFMVMPDTDEPMPSADVVRAAAAQLASKQRSLGGAESYRKLRSRVSARGVQLYVREPLGEDSVARAALISATFDDKGTYIDGFVATSSEVLRAAEAMRSNLFAAAPAKPSLLVSTQVKSNELNRWLGSSDKSFGARLAAEGFAPSVLAAALNGSSQLAFYIEPELLLIDALSAADHVGPIGTILAHAGVADEKLTTALFSALLEARGEAFSRTEETGAVRLNAFLEQEPVEVRVTKEELRVQAGPALEGRKSVDVLAAYRSLLPAGAFGPGHLSLVADLSQVRRDLEVGQSTGDAELDAYRRLLSRTVEQLTSVERLAFDLAPELGGARLTGTLLYAPGRLGAVFE